MSIAQSTVIHWPTTTEGQRHELCRTLDNTGQRPRYATVRSKVTCNLCNRRLDRIDQGLPPVIVDKQRVSVKAARLARVREQMEKEGLV